MKTLLLTGASGFLGWNISTFQQKDWQILGTFFKNKNSIHPNIKAEYLDLRDKTALDVFFKNHPIDGIVHTAALSRPGDCAKMPELSYEINVEVTKHLARQAAQLGIPFIFTSSSQVFDGEHAPYAEKDTPNAITIYAEHKIAAEKAVFEVYAQAVVLRMPLMYGATSPSSKNFLKEWLAKMQTGDVIQSFSDEYRTALSGQSAAAIIFEILKKYTRQGIRGELFHVASNERLSRAEFAFLMKEVFDPAQPNIQPCLQADVKMPAKRPKDLSLDISKLQAAIDFQPKSVREELTLLRGQVY